jgi:folate/biopterin transporter
MSIGDGVSSSEGAVHDAWDERSSLVPPRIASTEEKHEGDAAKKANHQHHRHHSVEALATGTNAGQQEEDEGDDDEEDDLSPTREGRISRYTNRASKLVASYRILGYVPNFLALSNVYSVETVAVLGWSYFLVKGISAHAVSASTLPMFKDVMGVSSGEYQTYVRIGVLGWAMKPLIGVVSDNVTLGSYHKRYYLVLACIAGAVATNVWAFLPREAHWAAAAALCTFVCNLCLAVVDLLCEGQYSRMIQAAPRCGSAVVTWVWGWVMVGGVAAAAVQGPMADSGHAPACLHLTSVLLAMAAVPLYLNWLREKRVEIMVRPAELPSVIDVTRSVLRPEQDGDSGRATRGKEEGQQQQCESSQPRLAARFSRLRLSVRRDCNCPLKIVRSVRSETKAVSARHDGHTRYLTEYCLVMAFCIMAITIATIWCSRQVLLVVSLCSIVFLSASSFFVLPRVIALANLYMFLKEALYVQLPGPMDYFFTTTACGDSFPQFSYSFYQTFTTIVGYAAGAVGVSIFHRYFSTRNFRLTFWATSLVRIVASLFDILLIMRLNKTWLGLNDHVAYFFGDAVVFGACQMLDFMPAVILMSKLCPNGHEATLYALMAGYSNLGQAISNSLGTLLMHSSLLPVEGCDVKNLPTLVFVGHCLLPLLTIPLTFLLVPNTRVDEDIHGVEAPPDHEVKSF